jgi:hypothetical protein
MRDMITDYPKNRKPMVKVAATEKGFKQGGQNLSPLTKPVASKTGYSEDVLIKNGVTNASSAKLQAASKLPGRIGQGGAHKKLS